MAYSTQADIEGRFGTKNVLLWSQLDPDAVITDTARVAAAIAYADATIDNRLRGGRYALPLSGDSGATVVVKDWSARLAGVWLYESRGLNDGGGDEGENRLTFHRTEVMREIDSVVAGVRRLGWTAVGSAQPGAPSVVIPPASWYAPTSSGPGYVGGRVSPYPEVIQ